MDYQLISDNKALNRSPFFLNVFGRNRNCCCGGFSEALNTYDAFTDAIAASVGIVFTGISITAANDKRGLRAMLPKSSRFPFKPQFGAILAEWPGRIQ